MEQKDCITFLQKYARGLHTDDEHRQFMHWLRTAPMLEVEALMEQCDIDAFLPGGQADVEALSLCIEKAIDRHDGQHTETITKNKVVAFTMGRWVAAAVLLICIGTVLYFYFKKPDFSSQAVAVSRLPATTNDLLPGGKKATLTLGNGTVINLDSTASGMVLHDSGVQITKTHDGILAYQPINPASTQPTVNTLSTPAGGQFAIKLPDGSYAWLNASSSIQYPTAFTGHERRVQVYGEVYFEVAHDATKPFKVSVQSHTGKGGEISVLGTHFNVNAYDDESTLSTTLLEGAVIFSNGKQTTLLKPGQQVQASTTAPIKVINNVNTHQIVAWKEGYFSFEKADLKTIMRQIAKWYNVEVSYEGNIPARQFVGKISRNSKASEVLKILQESKVNFRIEEKKIIVMP